MGRTGEGLRAGREGGVRVGSQARVVGAHRWSSGRREGRKDGGGGVPPKPGASRSSDAALEEKCLLDKRESLGNGKAASWPQGGPW